MYLKQVLISLQINCHKIIIEKNESEAIQEAEEICKKLLANPVVHEYSISVAK